VKALGKWDVDLPGEHYLWEPDEVSVGECLMLENESGQGYERWIADVGDGRAVACQILVWFLRRKAGRQEDRLAIDFPLRKLEITAFIEDGVDDDPEASAGSEPATASSSSTATESSPGSGTS